MKPEDKRKLYAILELIEALSTIPQSYTLKLDNYRNWTDSEWINFNYLLNEYIKRATK